jgi:hypothetical protein
MTYFIQECEMNGTGTIDEALEIEEEASARNIFFFFYYWNQ